RAELLRSACRIEAGRHEVDASDTRELGPVRQHDPHGNAVCAPVAVGHAPRALPEERTRLRVLLPGEQLLRRRVKGDVDRIQLIDRREQITRTADSRAELETRATHLSRDLRANDSVIEIL